MRDGIGAALREGGKQARLTLVTDKGQLAAEIDTAAVDDLIQKLCAIRTQMKPAIPRTPEGIEVTTVINPAFGMSFDPLSGKPAIAIRHPGIGWIMAFPSDDDRTALIKHLMHERNPFDGVKHG